MPISPATLHPNYPFRAKYYAQLSQIRVAGQSQLHNYKRDNSKYSVIALGCGHFKRETIETIVDFAYTIIPLDGAIFVSLIFDRLQLLLELLHFGVL